MNAETGVRKHWMTAIVEIARLKGVQITHEEMQRRIDVARPDDWMPAMTRAARAMGLQFKVAHAALADVPARMLPVLAELQDGSVVVVQRCGPQDVVVTIPTAGGAVEQQLSLDEFRAQATGRLAFVEPLSMRTRDARLDEFLRARKPSWFRDILLRDKSSYGQIVLASLFGNLLAFATSLFAMQVWDRVVPAQSIPTLWVLALGVTTAILFELLLRTARVSLADRIGKRADLAISSHLFARALDIRNDARPKSTGSFIAQLRDIEQLRELLTSTTIAALIDLPFVVLFLALFTALAGPLIFIVLGVLVAIVVPGLLLQLPMSRLAREGMRESALRNAILVESIERVEEIKALQAEPRFQTLWERFTNTAAQTGIAQRRYTALYVNWTQTLQHLAYTAVLVAGTYMVLAGEMTMGSLIACSILTNRVIVLFMPLGQMFARWQNAKVALAGLNDLLAKPVDHDPERGLLRRPALTGAYRFQNVRYAYGENGATVFQVDDLSIRPGERIALLGRIGAGKSTMLRLLAGMAQPTSGKILLDGTDLGIINPADVRRDIGYLNQNAQLFLGTIRENLAIGRPDVTDEEILQVLAVTGGLHLVQGQSQGLDLMLQEGGVGLSGGQRQTLLLARTLLRNSSIVLLDEPSAAMDESTERQFVERLRRWAADRTMVIATNRAGILPLVDRIIVIDNGRIAMDGPKTEVLKSLSRPQPVSVAAVG
jgi:ATP-binding cassette subfamily C protein LapB